MKRLNIIRQNDKIYYKIERRFMFFWWKPYYITPCNDRFEPVDITFKDKETAELFINWKDIKYINKIIKLDWNTIYKKVQYRVFDNDYQMHNQQFATVADAKEYIESLPRTVNYKYYK